jgi:iron(III) transport system permease protein
VVVERVPMTVAMSPSVALPAPRGRPATGRAVQWTVWLLTVVVVIGPLLPLLYASFRTVPLYLPGGDFSVDGYRQLFADPAFVTAVKNTLGFAAIGTALAVVLGSTFAVLCTRTNMPGRRVFSLLVLLPIVLPPLGLLLGWDAVYGEGGYVTTMVGRAHLPTWDLSSVVGMGLLAGCISVPLAFLTCRASLQGTDPRLEDAARSAGAGPLTVIRRVTLPLLRPAIVNSALLIFVLAFETLGIPLLIGSHNNIDFYASYLYRTWQNSPDPDPASVSAGAILLLVTVSLLIVVRSGLLRTAQRFIGATRAQSDTKPLDLGRWRVPMSAGMSAFLVIAVVIPMIGLGIASFVQVFTPLIPPWELLTLDNWRQLTTTGLLTDSIVHSVLIALIGGIVTTFVVAIATLVAHRSGFRFRALEGPLLMYPRAIPGIIIGIGFFWSFLLVNPPGGYLRNSIWGVAIALCVRNVTLAYVVLLPSVMRISTDLDAAARTVGAGWWTISTRVLLPLLRPALVAAFILMFVTLLNDYDPAVFLVTPDSQIMGVTILQTYQTGLSGPVAALALVQITITVIVLGAGAFILRRRVRG